MTASIGEFMLHDFVVCIPILAQARNLKNTVAVLALQCCLATSCTPW